MNVITSSTRKMPYAMRCIARELLLALRVGPFARLASRSVSHNPVQVKFPSEPEEVHAVAIGQVIYYRFLNPAIVYVLRLHLFRFGIVTVLDQLSTPETFDIVPTTINASARRNLAEISKMLTQIASGTVFSDDNPCLTPLNTFVSEAIQQFSAWLIEGMSRCLEPLAMKAH